jgi:hypothetical protein
MEWLKKYPRLYAIAGVLLILFGVLAGMQTLWGFWSNEPLIPVLALIFTTGLEWQKVLAIGISVVMLATGLVLLVLIFRQTKKPKGIPKLKQFIDNMSQQQKITSPPDVQSKADKYK